MIIPNPFPLHYFVWDYNFLFMPTCWRTQLGRETRATCTEIRCDFFRAGFLPSDWRQYCGSLWWNATSLITVRGGAGKSLARPGRKQATATKPGIYSTHSPRSSIHFLARCSNFCKPLKKKSEVCPSNQVAATAITSASDEKWRTFNCFFSPGNRW